VNVAHDDFGTPPSSSRAVADAQGRHPTRCTHLVSWTQAEILAAVREGERFVLTEGDVVTDTILEVATCPACSQPTLRLPSSTA
jgi:hypothetical protein